VRQMGFRPRLRNNIVWDRGAVRKVHLNEVSTPDPFSLAVNATLRHLATISLALSNFGALDGGGELGAVIVPFAAFNLYKFGRETPAASVEIVGNCIAHSPRPLLPCLSVLTRR
jgi:hypothetical protein